MSINHTQQNTAAVKKIEVLIIGAGVTGLYQLYSLRKKGFDVEIFEGGGNVGGTWYWNRYPGARFDSESYTYGYSFSEELLQEWEWDEHFAGQPETERYLNFVTEKFKLRPHISFNTWVEKTIYNEKQSHWEVTTSKGKKVIAQYVIACVGPLSAPYTPSITNEKSFKGITFHTARWPENLSLKGKRVGVIGTGPTAVQMIPEIAKEVGELVVFQRSPRYCLPLNNSKIDEETQKKIKSNYPKIFAKCEKTLGGFIHNPLPINTFDVSEEKRERYYEKIWSEPGFKKWFGNFADTATDEKANFAYCEFIKKKIRQRVTNPNIAKLLCPKDHYFGTKRVPLETGYYEAYNRENVTLVDVKTNPIEAFTEKGLKTTIQEYELDIIIYATGFDAVTGQLTKMDIKGVNALSLKDHWSNGIRSYMGLISAGFPNLFVANMAVFCNVPRCAEMIVNWMSECIEYAKKYDYESIDTTKKAEDDWLTHVNDHISHLLRSNTSSWYYGTNIPGKKSFSVYVDVPSFRKRMENIAENDYVDLVFNKKK